MMKTAALIIVMSLAAVVQAGPDRHLGESVRRNVILQAVDPNPNYTDVPPPGTSGRRAADAMIRYQTGKLKPLLKTNGKTDVGGQGGASDGDTVSIPLISSGGSPN